MDQQPRWRKRTLWLGGTLVALMIGLILIQIGYSYFWTGFGQTKVNGEVQPAKTLWDWLELLIVPLVLAVGGYLFNSSQSRATQAAAERRAQDDALQAYLDGMSQLLTDKDRPLHRTQPGDSLNTIARARTLTVLSRLDRSHKRSVLQFLSESGLIARDRPIIALHGADLARAKLNGAGLLGNNLSGASLTEADLDEAMLELADLSNANLTEADLRGANLSGANLSSISGWTVDQLASAGSLEGATMPDGHTLKGDHVRAFYAWLRDRKREGRKGDGERTSLS